MPKPVSEEDFEKKWVTSYQPPGGTVETVTDNASAIEQKSGSDISSYKKTESIQKQTSGTGKSVLRQMSMTKSSDGKLDDKRKSQSSDSGGKRTSFYIQPTPTEQDKTKGSLSDPSQRLSSIAEGSKTLLQPCEMDHRQSSRFIIYYE